MKPASVIALYSSLTTSATAGMRVDLINEGFDVALRVRSKLDEAEQRARDGVGELRGVLRVNAPMSFGLRRLGKLIPLFHEQHPNIELQLVLSDQQVDAVVGAVQEFFD